MTAIAGGGGFFWVGDISQRLNVVVLQDARDQMPNQGKPQHPSKPGRIPRRGGVETMWRSTVVLVVGSICQEIS